MKNSTKITLILILITNSLFGAQPYKVKKCKHKLVQSPRVIVADNQGIVLPTVNTAIEIKKIVELEPETLKLENTTPKLIAISDLSINSNCYLPNIKQIKKAKRMRERLKDSSDEFPITNNQLIAALLALILGLFGIHRFYLGYIWQGILQLVILGGLALTSLFWLAWIWVVIDLVRIILGNLKPKKSDYEFTI
ncbi:TM2 domain-containing protein [Bacteroidia bacterium]|nr:TM2 domain-containing protein [Bacteroidia bacterium]MDC0561817.1 TM2 domain-containing protein [Bacteroidia bacterium]